MSSIGCSRRAGLSYSRWSRLGCLRRPSLVLAGEEDVGGVSRWAEAAPILQEHNYQEL